MKHHIYPFESKVSYEQRIKQMKQVPRLIWFTGLSGSGKTTLAVRLEHYLFHQGYKVYLLDGDNLRSGLSSDLGFTIEDRKENMRRVGEVAKLMMDSGLVVLCASISPFEEDRALIRDLVGGENFTEVFVHCPLHVCEKRDTKGLYQKARDGEINNFTGISAPYEEPTNPDLTIKTADESVEKSLDKLIDFVEPLLESKKAEKE